MVNFFENLKVPLKQLCENYKVEKLYAFGSVLTPSFNSKSDVDLIVKFKKTTLKPEDIGELYFDFSIDLEQLFERKVDLIIEKEFRNPVFRSNVEKTKTLIYG